VAFTTLTRYLKLKVDSDLSADAVYNLQRIDALASTFVVDATEKLNIQSKGDIEIEPNDLALGGTGSGGKINLGTEDHAIEAVTFYAEAVRFQHSLSIKNTAENKSNYLKLLFNSSETTDKSLTFDVGNDDRNIAFDGSGTVVVKDGSGNFTAGTITAALVGNVTGNVSGSAASFTGNLTGEVTGTQDATVVANGVITDAKVSNTANISDTKLAIIATAGKVSNSATTATNANTPSAIVARDASGNFSAGTITAALTGNVTGNASTATDLASGSVLSVNKGGTGANNAAGAIENLLPTYSSNANKILGLKSDGSGLEWKAPSTGGTVNAVEGPLVIDETGETISLPTAGASTDGYLSFTDWNTFNEKEPAITSGTTSQYWRGDKSWQTLNKAAVGLGNVDNTSDVNKPISSATQTALNAKYDSSNPANYVNASQAAAAAPVQSVNGQTNAVVLTTDTVSEGTAQYFTATRAKTATVVNSTAGNETDQAPSVASVKSFVAENAGPKFTTTWASGDGNAKTVTHNLGTREVSITIYDENYKTVWIDEEERNGNNTVLLTRVGTVSSNWTVIIKKL